MFLSNETWTIDEYTFTGEEQTGTYKWEFWFEDVNKVDESLDPKPIKGIITSGSYTLLPPDITVNPTQLNFGERERKRAERGKSSFPSPLSPRSQSVKRFLKHALIAEFTIICDDSRAIDGLIHPGLTDCYILNNRIVNSYVGIVYLGNSSPTIIGNEISGSDTDGIECIDGSSPIIANNLIFDNNNVTGIDCMNGTSPIIINNVIAHNGWWGIHAQDSSNPVIMNNIIFNNGDRGIVAVSDSNPTVDYNLITPAQFSGITLGKGNILGEDPLFIDADNRNYHLQPSSPAIDAGNPDSLYNDNPKTQQGSGRNDMGAYGGPYGIYYIPPIADFSAPQRNGEIPFTVQFQNDSFGIIAFRAIHLSQIQL